MASVYVELVHAAKRRIVLDALTRHGGNRTRAARELGVLAVNLQRLMRQHRITMPAPGRGKP